MFYIVFLFVVSAYKLLFLTGVNKDEDVCYSVSKEGYSIQLATLCKVAESLQ